MFLDAIENKMLLDTSKEEEILKTPIDLLVEDSETIQYVLSKHPNKLSENLLIKLLKSKKIYIRMKACSLLTELYATKNHKEEYIVFYRYYLRETESYDKLNQLYTFLSNFLSCKSSMEFDLKERKSVICKDKSIMDAMVKYCPIKEVQYHILLVVYVLSFENECIPQIVPFLDTIISCLEERSREKIMRICYMIVVNICTKIRLQTTHWENIRTKTHYY